MNTHQSERNGPTDHEIEDMEIERQIEYAEEKFRGEHGEEAQREEAAQRQATIARLREEKGHEEEAKRLTAELGSPALAKACMDSFDYALKLRSGEVVRFTDATCHANGWITLQGVEQCDPALTVEQELPFPAPRGVDVRLTDVIWVMDAPCGS